MLILLQYHGHQPHIDSGVSIHICQNLIGNCPVKALQLKSNFINFPKNTQKYFTVQVVVTGKRPSIGITSHWESLSPCGFTAAAFLNLHTQRLVGAVTQTAGGRPREWIIEGPLQLLAQLLPDHIGGIQNISFCQNNGMQSEKKTAIYFSVFYISRRGGWTFIRGKRGIWWLYLHHYISVKSHFFTSGRIQPAAPASEPDGSVPKTWSECVDDDKDLGTNRESSTDCPVAQHIYCQYADCIPK